MSTLTSSLIVKLVNQVTAPAKQVVSSIRGIGQAFSGLSSKNLLAGLDIAIKRNNEQLKAMQGRLATAVAGGYVLQRALTGPLQAAMDFESAMADVKKVVDFDNLADFKNFQQDVLEMTTRIPMAGKELSAIVAEAGQSGIAKNELLKFTEMAAKVGVAFDISAREAGEALAKMKTGLALNIEETGKLADAMNHLSNNQASKAREVLDVVRRVGAMGKQYGFKPKEVAAFGSAMVAAGAQTDVASTSFMNMGRALTKGSSATKRQRAAYRRLGLDAKKVARSMQKDAVGTTLDAMERIGKLPAHLRASVVSDLFGDEARALGPLLTNLPLLRNSLKLVADEQQYLGSANKEYVARSATFGNSLVLLRNRLQRLGIVIGTALFPPLTALMNQISPLIDTFTQWASAHPELVSNAILAASALVGLKVATTGLRVAMLLVKGGILDVASGLLGLGKPFARLAAGAKGAVTLQRALAKMGGHKYSKLRMIGDAFKGMFKAIPGMSTLGKVVRPLIGLVGLLGRAFVSAGIAMMATPVGWIVAAVAAIAGAAYLCWKNWDQVAPYFRGMWEGVKQIFGGAINVIAGILTGDFGRAWEGVKQIFSGLYEYFTNGWKLIGDIFKFAIQEIDALLGTNIWDCVSSWIDAGRDAANKFMDAVLTEFEKLKQWFKELPGRIKEWIGSIEIPISLPTWLGGAPDNPGPVSPASTGQTIGAFAKGGHFSGGTMLVGEEGPELITASRSGHVHTAGETRRMLGGSGGGKVAAGGLTLNLGGMSISINGVSDPRAIADQVIGELQARIGSALTGIQADLGYTS